MKKILISLILFINFSYASFYSILHAMEYTNELEKYLYPQSASKTISMDFKDASLNDIFKIFSQQSGMNFIASTELSDKTINIYLDNVPVDEALERILSANDLTYEIKPGSNIFVVKKLDVSGKNVMTRVFTLKNATIPSSKINSTLGSMQDTSSSSSGASASPAAGAAGAAAAGAAQQTATGILGAVQALLTDDGSVVEDARTNSLIVTDIPSQFPIIEQTIARLDVPIPQILIEAEMLDISKGTSELLGAKFGGSPFEFSGPSKRGFWPLNQEKILGGTIGFDESVGGGEEGSSVATQYSAGSISFEGLSVVLNFLKTQTDTKSLARPRILTLNNETALIQIKTDEAIGVSTTTTSSDSSSQSSLEAERVETGVFLKVTPQVNSYTQEITMAIEPRVVQARQGASFTVEGGGQVSFKDPEERGTKSILRVRDGDTVIIGGLLRTDSTSEKTKVPGLEKIPLLGAAFRHKDDSESERELVIFITPHILNEDTAYQKTIFPESSRLTREQNIPVKKTAEIDKELSFMEQKRF